MPDTNYISKVTLPSAGTTGITYYLKDEEARSLISGGISFKIVWTATDYGSTTTPSTAKLATIPEGVTVAYNNGANTAVGTLAASADTKAIFYLIYSKTQAGNIDTFDEFVTITNDDTSPVSYFWEKIGDTQVDLSNVVTDVTLNKQSDTAIGSDATFTITQPTVALSTGATAGAGVISVATGISSATASGDSVTALTGLGTPSTATVLTGVKVTTQPTVTLTANTATATGRLKYVEDVTGGSTSPTKVHLSATASDGAVSAGGDSVTAITGLGTPSTGTAVSGISTAKLATTSMTGVQSSTTTASKATVGTATSQTTATGASTASTNNNDFLKGISVQNETLIFGAATLNTQTTSIPNVTFADVTVPIKNASATTVATGSTTSSGSGATIATGSSGTITAVTGYANPTTDTVLGTASTFTVTDPTITISTSGSSGPEVVGDVSDITVSPTYKYMSGSASGTVVGADGTASAVTGYASPTTDTVLGTGSTITVTPSTTNIKATASGANTAWNNKDTVTVLTDSTSVVVTKGGSNA